MKIVPFPRKHEPAVTGSESAESSIGWARRLLGSLDREACAHCLVTGAVTWSLAIWLATFAEFVRTERVDGPVPVADTNLARAEGTKMAEPAALVSKTNLIETGGGAFQKLERSGAVPGV